MTPKFDMSSMPEPLQVALDKMREMGDTRADACSAGIMAALCPPRTVQRLVTEFLLEMVMLGVTPRRLGLPPNIVTALGLELKGLSPRAIGALPQTAAGYLSDAEHYLEATVHSWPREDGTRSIGLERMTILTPTGLTTIEALND